MKRKRHLISLTGGIAMLFAVISLAAAQYRPPARHRPSTPTTSSA